ncbi:copper homeostasis protein CutC [Chthonobacter rhizosphaerae]|uniref:copper homeostasis protein CutC n=1 Tax=Chthonobacter rhizosphaerae TaxID=2735553 RepID=UPI0015EF490C|nr:copper homeostasis protein CutC [Chthonobacter rhizosphaerae]
MSIALEVCVSDVAGLDAAVAGGADRIELTSALELGGLTPSAGLMDVAAGAAVPVHAIVRPHPGGFVYDDRALDVMIRDIGAARRAGLAGVVVGASRPDGRLDETALRRLVAAADGLFVTLHRAFDLAPDPLEALELAVGLGIGRILTSGGAVAALDGADTIAAVVQAAAGRVAVMAGGGVRVETADLLVGRTGVRDVHASCSVPTTPGDPRVTALGWGPPLMRRTDRATVEAMRHKLNGVFAR